MKNLFISFGLIFFVQFGFAQTVAPSVQELLSTYSSFQESSITTRRFTIEQLLPVIESYKASSHLQFKKMGTSIEGRPIYMAKFGHGPVPVLFWSQMHGDESTATMALFDFFRWMDAGKGNHLKFRDELEKHFQLYFIPMLNPDGAERFQRRNAANIDLNRDAIHLSSPESRLLKKVRDSIEPLVGFNLHDQSIFYRAGRQGKQSAITFLAPAFDFDNDINGVRLRAMQIISVLNDSIQTVIPDRVATYDDAFEPRAFGDNTQKWGTSAILIESGGYNGDPEKQFLRKLNFVLYIKALESLMNKTFEVKTIRDYNAIPVNQRNMMSLKIRNLLLPVGNQNIRLDIGYLYTDQFDSGHLKTNARIADVGDLSIYDGFEDFDAAGMNIVRGKWYEKRVKSFSGLRKLDIETLIRSGYLGFHLRRLSGIPVNLPLHFSTASSAAADDDPFDPDFQPGKNPTFMLQKEDKMWVVNNGQLYTMDQFVAAVKEAIGRD